MPFPLLHVDTGHNYAEVIAFRDAIVERLGLRLEVAHVQDWIDDGRLTERPDGTRNPLQTVPLLDSIVEKKYDAVFGGGRRDEERARAKERIMSLRTAFGRWDPRASAPSCGTSTTAGTPPASTCACSRLATGPSSTSGATSSASTSSCRRSTTPTAARCSAATGCGWPRARGAVRAAARCSRPTVRYRTVGDGSCTGAVESTATTLDEIIAEVTASRLTERGATRADDRLSEAAMEDRKREGYF